MEFEFFKNWEPVKNIKVGRKLMKKIVPLKSLEHLGFEESTFPEKYPDRGEKISRYVLDKNRYFFTEELSDVLTEECHKLSQKEASEEKRNNPQVLIDLLSCVLNKEITHFTLG
jgi:hypothetical protein